MAYALVQSKTMVGQDGSAGTVQLAFDANPAAGNTIVCIVFWSHTVAESASGVATPNDTLAEIPGATIYSTDIVQNLSMWRKSNIVGGVNSKTVTASFIANRTFRKLWIGEYAGGATSAEVDGSSELAGAASIPDPGTITPTEDNELIVAAAATDTSAPVAAAGFTTRETDTGYFFTVIEQIQTTATERTAFFTGPTSGWAAVAASFKVAAGGGSVVPIMMAQNE